MARLAYRFAISSPHVTATSIEAGSFPDLATKYQVRAVPHTVINDAEILIGAVPESALLKSIQTTLAKPDPA